MVLDLIVILVELDGVARPIIQTRHLVLDQAREVVRIIAALAAACRIGRSHRVRSLPARIDHPAHLLLLLLYDLSLHASRIAWHRLNSIRLDQGLALLLVPRERGLLHACGQHVLAGLVRPGLGLVGVVRGAAGRCLSMGLLG